jgi:hypothetical protein
MSVRFVEKYAASVSRRYRPFASSVVRQECRLSGRSIRRLRKSEIRAIAVDIIWEQDKSAAAGKLLKCGERQSTPADCFRPGINGTPAFGLSACREIHALQGGGYFPTDAGMTDFSALFRQTAQEDAGASDRSGRGKG